MNFNKIIYRTHLPHSEIQKVYEQAYLEASYLGMEEDDSYIESIMESILDIDETEVDYNKLNNDFVKSGKPTLNEYLDSLTKVEEDGISGGASGGTTGGPTVSTNYGMNVRPQHNLTKDELDDVEEKDKEEK